MEPHEGLRISLQHVGGGSKTREFYVYVHRDPQGRVFYVGKGKEDRAWEIGGHNDLWRLYVDRFDGAYDVEIIETGLSEDEALWLEEDVMKQYGGQLVNWVNMHRTADYEGYARYWELRWEIDQLLEKAGQLEETDTEEAIVHYRQAIAKMKEAESFTALEQFTGLALELYKESRAKQRVGNTRILDLVTTCLVKLQREEEALLETQQYLECFPYAGTRPSFRKIVNRIKLPRD